ncbi:DUF6804 family protein [Piscibacillus halophilus]|uniref:DUF6804 family protein n=1 Tax=Piscibacillus halophilus TaxID=571933 RepID=UPI00158B9349|nr:DUF6804 family protein [Piscibacillus halophilus]
MSDIVRLGLIVYLLAAVFGFVYDFITLRWVVFIGIIYLIHTLVTKEVISKQLKNIFLVIFVGIAFLFNPIIPVYLYDIGTWRLIDLVVALVLFFKPIIINVRDQALIDETKFKSGMMSDHEQSRYLNEKLKYDFSRFEEPPEHRVLNEVRETYGIDFEDDEKYQHKSNNHNNYNRNKYKPLKDDDSVELTDDDLPL